jgi:hypothetical protein
MIAIRRTTLRPFHGWFAPLMGVVVATALADVGRAEMIYAPTSLTLVDADVSQAVTQATQFHTTATGYVITGVSFEMQLASGTTGFLNWLIYTDTAGIPGVPVSGVIFNQDVSTLSGTYTTVSTGSLSVVLSATTNYWLVLEGQSLDPGVIVNVQQALAPSGTGSPFRAASNTGSWAPLANVAVVGTITAVPEPATIALAAIGSGLVALATRRRFRSARATSQRTAVS